MRNSVTYRDLESLLLKQGFELNRVKGSHHLFVHNATDTTIMLPADSSLRRALPSQVVSVQRLLDERGLLARDDFDDLIKSRQNGHSAVGRSR